MKKILFIYLVFILASCGSNGSEKISEGHSDNGKAKIDSTEFSIEFPVSEKYTISAKKDTLFQLKSGKIIYFPKDAFETNGKTSEQINITITDISSVSDIIKMGLSTNSDSSTIETNGMLKIEAKQEGTDELCMLKKNYVLGFPVRRDENTKIELTSNYIIFNGVNESEGKTSWKTQERKNELLEKTIRAIDYSIVIAVEDTGKYNQPDYLTISSNNMGFRKYFGNEFQKRTKNFKKSILESECNHLGKNGINAEVVVKKDGSLLFKNFNYGNFKHKEIQNIVASIIKDCPKVIPFYHDGKPRDNQIGIWIGVKNEYTAGTMEEFKSKFKQKLKFQEKNGQPVISKDELDYMLFESNSLGWINCDRFINFKKEDCLNFMASLSDQNEFDKVVPYFVFTRIKSAMQFYPDQKGNYSIPNIPIGEKGYVMALGYKGDKIYFFERECTIGKSTFEFKIEEPLNANSFDRIDKLWNCDYGGRPLL
ncbi:MAG: hypothetical protein ACK40M_10625 [Flavobacteriales bacterium]